jgi:DNA polymerase I-like protein with 3'-5' exonuclease and polymerase domains
VAFLPQSSAAAIMKDTILEIGKSEYRPFMPANLSVHDSICLQVHKRMVDQTVEFLATLMTREIPLMNNLQIGCEVKVGKNWADMQKVKKIAID